MSGVRIGIHHNRCPSGCLWYVVYMAMDKAKHNYELHVHAGGGAWERGYGVANVVQPGRSEVYPNMQKKFSECQEFQL